MVRDRRIVAIGKVTARISATIGVTRLLIGGMATSITAKIVETMLRTIALDALTMLDNGRPIAQTGAMKFATR